MTEPEPIDVVVTLLKRWRTIAIFVVLGAGAAIAYAGMATEWYSATLSVVPSQRSQDIAAMSLAAKLPGLESFSTDVQRIEAVLSSTSVADEVIAKFKLEERYGTEHLEHAREALRSHCNVGIDRKSSVVSLTCEDTDPHRVMEMATFFGEVGNRVFGRISVSNAREERAFLETQVAKTRHDVDEASRKLREFQEQHKIIDLPEQSKAVISAMAQIKGELVSKQLELSYVSGFSGRGESNVVQLEQQIAVMESKLKQLEDAQHVSAPPTDDGSGSNTKSATGSGAKFFPGAMTVPELRFELEQLMREQKIQETVYGLMTQRFEMARVDEARDTSSFQILDNPTVPTYRSRPKRRQIFAMGILGALVLASAWILAPVWWRRRIGTK